MKQIVMVLGAEGMLGHQVARVFKEHPGYKTIPVAGHAPQGQWHIFDEHSPDVVINCIGVTARHPDFADSSKVFAANSVLPHRLLAECTRIRARLIHISTDCVFLGDKGGYTEKDAPSAIDIYGISKMLGEVDAPNALTIRTSLIGPELHHQRGLLEWFLAQKDLVTGYRRSIFSGLTTLEFAKVLRDFIAPSPTLHGIFHVGGEAINKYDLLRQIHIAYGLTTILARGEGPAIDRSLDSRRFRVCTGYAVPSWHQMIREMHHASQ